MFRAPGIRSVPLALPLKSPRRTCRMPIWRRFVLLGGRWRVRGPDVAVQFPLPALTLPDRPRSLQCRAPCHLLREPCTCPPRRRCRHTPRASNVVNVTALNPEVMAPCQYFSIAGLPAHDVAVRRKQLRRRSVQGSDARRIATTESLYPFLVVRFDGRTHIPLPVGSIRTAEEHSQRNQKSRCPFQCM